MQRPRRCSVSSRRSSRPPNCWTHGCFRVGSDCSSVGSDTMRGRPQLGDSSAAHGRGPHRLCEWTQPSGLQPIWGRGPYSGHNSNQFQSDLVQRLLLAGCYFDFCRNAWRCPACRRPAVLRLLEQVDGSIRPRSACRCETEQILDALGASFFDIEPRVFREPT